MGKICKSSRKASTIISPGSWLTALSVAVLHLRSTIYHRNDLDYPIDGIRDALGISAAMALRGPWTGLNIIPAVVPDIGLPASRVRHRPYLHHSACPAGSKETQRTAAHRSWAAETVDAGGSARAYNRYGGHEAAPLRICAFQGRQGECKYAPTGNERQACSRVCPIDTRSEGSCESGYPAETKCQSRSAE